MSNPGEAAPEAQPLAAPPGLDLWRLPLALPPARLAALAELLSPEERTRAERFRPPGAYGRFVAAHGQLRLLLAAALGASAAELRFEAGPHGKPALTPPWRDRAPGLSFNLSHSGEQGLLGIGRCPALGVDLERLRPQPQAQALAARYFAAPERADLAAVAGSQAEAPTFFNCWTRKEAFVKAQGLGLAWPLDSFAVTCLPEAPAGLSWSREGPEALVPWSLAAVDLGLPDYVGAVAWQRGRAA